ncbi:manganese catalase family protein [Actinoallomurus iriomotensis]|uniref:Mn-containing catalase n=1 Tax=Actinoallomurus iriomotensis TaxID=478107 RepID=A0A9W6RGI5_9ACTN|nr:manganese catalase family protein [Actinoallomurus iriomotensis]GLY75164.1 hypothetical protein Airi01_034310 [Actinoallomurus iriomotensis]
MFRHTDHLQFDAKPEKPDHVFAHKLQELIGGAYGEMTVTMQYLFQGWNCRMPGKYKDLIMDVATEEIGLEPTTVAPNALLDEEHAEHAQTIWHLSDGAAATDGGWASGLQPDGEHEFTYLMDPEPLGDLAAAPPPDPKLYATYDGSMGEPKGPVLGTETGPLGKLKDKFT